MPIYEYRCADCGFQNEYLQKVSEPPMTVCPSCGKESFRKLLTAAGFQLKGSGWYATDFKNAGKAATKAAPATAAKADAAAPASGSGGEAKPDAKSESSSSASNDKGAAPACAAG
jgi:putative FmdB family regulatory protein